MSWLQAWEQSSDILAASVFWAQNFLPVSTQKLREPIPQNNSKTWTSPFPKQATQGHVRSRAHTPARKCLRSYLIFSRTAFENWHGTAQHKSKITIEQTKKCARPCRTVPQWKSAFSVSSSVCCAKNGDFQNFSLFLVRMKVTFASNLFAACTYFKR